MQIEWDAGAQAGDVNGTVSTTNHLTSASPPILSRMSPGTAMVGDAIQIHGANFGGIIEVFLPLIMNILDEPSVNFPIFIGDPIAARPVEVQGEVFYTTTVDIPETIPETGQFFLSAHPDLLQQIVVDDEIVFLLAGEEIFVHTFSDGSEPPQLMLVEIPRSVMLSMAGQEVTVNYRDVYGSVVHAKEIWLQHVP